MSGASKRVGRFVVVGAGDYGQIHLRVYRQIEARGQGKLVGLATRTPESARRHSNAFGVPGFTDYRALIDELKPDAVSVVTPDHLHCEVTCYALSAGLHVLVEKPMDTSVSGARRMVEAARASGRLLQVDFHKRFDPSLVEVHRFVQSGGLGDPVYGNVLMEERITMPRDVINKWVAQTNPNWLVGIHMYDVLRWILGRDVKRVFAGAFRLNLEGIGPDTVDAVQARLEFEGGPSVEVQTSWILPESYPSIVNQYVRLVGTAGVAAVNLRDRGLRLYTAESLSTPNPNFLQERATPSGGTETVGYGAASIECFARNVRALLAGARLDGLKASWADADDGLAATRIAAAVDRSCRTGQPVNPEDVEDD